jgi:hypothetical protein
LNRDNPNFAALLTSDADQSTIGTDDVRRGNMSEQIRKKSGSAVEKAAANAADNTSDNVPDSAADNPHAHSSFGDTSLSVTPKDVEASDASAQDITERHLQSDNAEEKQQEMLDEAIDLSFPASDPPATTGGVTRIDLPKSPATP